MLKFNRLLLAALMTGLVSMASANFIAVEAERVNPLRLQLDAYTNQLLGVVEDQQGLVPIQVLQIELGKIIRSVPAIEQLIAAEERLKAQLQNAESGYFPQVSVNVGKGYRDNKTGSDGDVESLTLSLQQLIYDFGSLDASVDSTKMANDAIRANIAVQRSEVFLDLIAAQLNLAKEEQLFLLSEVFVDSRQRFADYIQERLSLGSASNADLTRARSQVLAAKGRLPDVMSRLESARNDYIELYGVAPKSGNWFNITDIINPEVMKIDIDQHPSFVNADLSHQSAISKLSSIEKGRWGTVTGDLGLTRSSLPGQADSKYKEASINYSAMLYTGGAQEAQIAEAQTAVVEAQYEVERVKRNLQASTSSAMFTFTQKMEGLSIKVQSLKAAREATQSVQNLFTYGRSSMTDVISAQRDELDAATELVESFSDYQLSYFELLHQTHNLLKLIDKPI